MNIEQRFLKSLLYATICVAITLTLLLISASLVSFGIAPLLVDSAKQLQQVDWEQIWNVCYLGTYILFAIFMSLFAIKSLKK